MDINEMKREIFEYCSKRWCHDCPFNNRCGDINRMSYEDLEWRYKTIKEGK